MSRAARLRTLSSSASARRYCSQWLLARSSASASERCRRSNSTSCAAVSGKTSVASAPLWSVILKKPSRDTSHRQPRPPAGRAPSPGRLRPAWGSASRIQGRAEQFSRHIDDWNDPLIGHARRAYDPEHTHHGAAVGVGSRDHAAIIQYLVAGLMADEDLHPFRLEAVVEQMQEVTLLIERFEQAPQLFHVGELSGAHEIGLALDDVLEVAVGGPAFEHLLRHGDRVQHDLVQVRVRLGQLPQDLLAHFAQNAAAKLLVQVVRSALELIR